MIQRATKSIQHQHSILLPAHYPKINKTSQELRNNRKQNNHKWIYYNMAENVFFSYQFKDWGNLLI